MKHIKHIFFDLDNTLWDHRKNAYLTLKELFYKEKLDGIYALNFQDFHQKYDEVNERLWEQIRDGEIDKEYLRKHRFYDTFLHFGVDNLELGQKIEYQFLDEIIRYNELVEGTLDVLNYLKNKDYELHIISNGFYEVTHRKVQHSGLSPFFESITSADDAGVRKPNPKIFQHALNQAKAEKKESILIGDDWIADIKGAQNFGMEVIFFDALRQDLFEENLTCVKHLKDLQNLF